MLRTLCIAVASSLALAACAGAAAPGPMAPTAYDEDDPCAAHEAAPPRAPAPVAEPARPDRSLPPPGSSAGEIERLALHDVLEAGPGRFLAGIEVEPVFREQRFAGWQIVRFEPADPRIARAPLAAGDIVLAVNARSIAKPQQLQRVWEDLRTASELVIAGERSGAAFELRYAIRAAQP